MCSSGDSGKETNELSEKNVDDGNRSVSVDNNTSKRKHESVHVASHSSGEGRVRMYMNTSKT